MRLGPVEFDTGYSLLIVLGFLIWISVPVINTSFGVSVMSSEQTLPIIGSHTMNVIIGGGLAGFGVIGYTGHRFSLW